MIRRILLLIPIVGLACSLAVVAQESAVDQILDQLPARHLAQGQELMAQLSALGADGIVSVSQKLGTDSDLAARYALSGIAKYIGKAQTTEAIETGFIQAMEALNDIDHQAFLLEQWQFFATNRSVPALTPYIKTICEPVIYVLAEIGTPQALEALIAAQADTRGYCQHSLTKAIGTFSSPAAATALQSLANSNDADLKSIALQGLANSSEPTVAPLLQTFAQENPGEGQPLLTKYYIGRADAGHAEGLIQQCNQLLAAADADEPTQAQAVHLLASYGGAAAKKPLLKLLKKGAPHLALAVAQALGSAEALPMKSFFKTIKKATPDVQVQLLNSAAKRQYTPGLSLAQSYLKATDPTVQVAAIRAVSALAGASGLDALVAITRSSTNRHVTDAAVGELAQHLDASRQGTIASALTAASDAGKSSLIRLAQARGMSQLWPQVSPLLGSNDAELRRRAFASMPQLAAQEPLSALAASAGQAQTAEEEKAVVRTILAKSTDPGQKSDLVAAVIGTFGPDHADILYQILPSLGGEQALGHVREKLSNDPGKLGQVLAGWQGQEAIPDLLAALAKDQDNRSLSRHLIRLSSGQSAEQHLLQMREVLDIVKDPDQIIDVLSSLRHTKIYPAFALAFSYLGDDALAPTAANSMVHIALPGEEEDVDGLTGTEVRQALARADSVLAASGDDYTRSILDEYLQSMPAAPGFVSMFNGRDLEGWQGLLENPIARSEMFYRDRRMKQDSVNKIMHQNWSVVDGQISFTGEGYDNLCSVKSYRDFEMFVDWKIEKDGDSGVYLRGSPQVQIWDLARTDVGAEVGSGGLYNNQVHESKPLVVADNPVGSWNTFRIIMIDDRVTVYLNGVKVTDHTVLENYWDRRLPIFREGPIELQAHGTDTRFRNVYVREIQGGPDLSQIEINDGYRSLFNGVNLDGWVGNKSDYRAENGEIVIYPGSSGGSGNLYTKEEYDNFSLRFEFKLTPGANNGLGIHAPLEGDAAYEGKEIQILDNTAPKYADLKPYQYHGSVYGIIPARKGALKPVGEWNRQEVNVQGTQISVMLNGRRILFDDIEHATRNGTLDGRDHPGLKRTKGHIGFLGHGSQVHFRNIRLKRLVDDADDGS